MGDMRRSSNAAKGKMDLIALKIDLNFISG